MVRVVRPLPLVLDPRSPVPVYEQVKQGIRQLILSGALHEGDALPSLREASQVLRINPNTVAKVYAQLEEEGLLQNRPGSGCYVQPQTPVRDDARQRQLVEVTRDYLRQVLDLGFSPREAEEVWRQICTGDGRHSEEEGGA